MNSSRRSFIKNSSILFAGATLIPNPYFTAPVKTEERLAIQLYSVDKEMYYDAPNTLKALKEVGYNYVEHAGYIARGFYGYTPSDFRRLINDSGLTLLSGHTVLELKHWDKQSKIFTREWLTAVEDAVTAGQQMIISPWLDKSLWTDERDFRNFMDVFNDAGESCRKAGIQFGYHNHDFEFTHTLGSQRLYDMMLRQTDAELVWQQLDIGNIDTKEVSITGLFNQYPQRFQVMHLKDVIETNDWQQSYKTTAIGEGILDIQNIITAARQLGGTTNFIIEQENYGTSGSFDLARQNLHAIYNMNNTGFHKSESAVAI